MASAWMFPYSSLPFGGGLFQFVPNLGSMSTDLPPSRQLHPARPDEEEAVRRSFASPPCGLAGAG
jgi:hypothetical protein